MTIETFNKLLELLIKSKGSDLHISAGKPVFMRINGKMTKINGPIFYRSSIVELLKVLLRSRWEEMVKLKNIDFSYKLNNNYSFRGNAYFQKDGPSIVLRIIPNKIPSIEELNLPSIIKKISDFERGLVLVTGITGSGKSTTLATLINEINKKYQKHILTIEDPIEFVHKPIKCLINQRNIGEDALNFADSLRAALREDPDIILIGEMRDKETIETALHAAETGHLVFSTLHTLDSKETINRILSVFPANEQNRIRYLLTNILQAIISQRLIETVDNKRVAALEIFFNIPRIRKLIEENRLSDIKSVLDEGHEIYKTQSFDKSLIDLVISGQITEETALKYATNPNDFRLNLAKEKNKITNQETNIKDILKLKENE